MANGVKEEINIVEQWAKKVNEMAGSALRRDEKTEMKNALNQIKGLTDAVLITMGVLPR